MAHPPSSFGKNRRVRRRGDFVQAQTMGRRVSSAHFLFLVYAAGPDGDTWRLGLVMTRKIGNAVVRNRIKRVCRECFRHESLFSNSQVAADLIVIAKAGAENLSFAEAKAEWGGVTSAIAARANDALRYARQRAQQGA